MSGEKQTVTDYIVKKLLGLLVQKLRQEAFNLLKNIFVRVVLVVLAFSFFLIGLFYAFNSLAQLFSEIIPSWAASLISGVIAIIIGALLAYFAAYKKS